MLPWFGIVGEGLDGGRGTAGVSHGSAMFSALSSVLKYLVCL